MLQREADRAAVLLVLALEGTALLEVRKGGNAAHVLPKPSGSAEPRDCQATNPNVSMGDVHKSDGMGLVLGVR